MLRLRPQQKFKGQTILFGQSRSTAKPICGGEDIFLLLDLDYKLRDVGFLMHRRIYQTNESLLLKHLDLPDGFSSRVEVQIAKIC